MSSKPTTERSSGTAGRATRAAAMVPVAWTSEQANTAVGGSARVEELAGQPLGDVALVVAVAHEVGVVGDAGVGEDLFVALLPLGAGR